VNRVGGGVVVSKVTAKKGCRFIPRDKLDPNRTTYNVNCGKILGQDSWVFLAGPRTK